jgi:ABC-type transport system substrate-binding protein
MDRHRPGAPTRSALMMKRLLVGAWLAGAALLAGGVAAQTTTAAAPSKVLRYAFPVAETGFDPAQVSDIYSRIVTAHIFEAPLSYDHLARPYKLKPSTAVAMPEISDDYKTFVFRIKPGIYFADDPAFNGKKRELVAADYVYSLKRVYDPKFKSPGQQSLEDEGIIGLQALRDEALKTGKPFDYDREVEGLKTLDRYTFRVKLRESRPRHLYLWTARDVGAAAVAREVVERYGDKIMEHPVGTGPFRLVTWRRSSQIVLERNPNYREDLYDAEPSADDAAGQALLQRLKGKRLPMVDRVELSIIEQSQPRWLSFLNGEQSFIERVPNEFIDQALPAGQLAPHLAKRGVQAHRAPGSDVTLLVFNMENAIVGGYTPQQVALRRAIALGNNVDREIQLARRGQAIRAQSMMTPFTTGYSAERRTEMSEYNPARAKALLDLYGFVDKNGDGWRERPDGSPLAIEMLTQSDASSRQLDELFKKDMDALGLRLVLKVAQWPENLKSARAGQFVTWRVGSSAASPDGQGALERDYGPSTGKGNLARFQLKAFDAIYERMKALPDGPERLALFDDATKLIVAYMPYRIGVHRILTDLSDASLVGYRRPAFWLDWWQYVDIDTDKLKTP